MNITESELWMNRAGFPNPELIAWRVSGFLPCDDTAKPDARSSIPLNVLNRDLAESVPPSSISNGHGCGFMTRRVIVFLPSSKAKTIGALNMIGLSVLSGGIIKSSF